VRTPDHILEGLTLGLVTRLGRFGWRPSVAERHDVLGQASWVTPFGDGAVIIARAYSYPRGTEYGPELAAVPPPSRLDGEGDARAYADRLAAYIAERELDAAVSLVLLRPTAGGMTGWVCGGATVWRIDGEIAPCTPSTVLEQKPGGQFMPGLVLSGIAADKVLGGHWFDVAGDSFALCLGMPPPAIADDELSAVAGHQPLHALERLGLHIAEACHVPSGVMGVWHRPGTEPVEGVTEWTESAKRLWSLEVATSWADLTDPLRGLAASYLEGMWELDELLDGDADRRMISLSMLNHGTWLSGALCLAGPRACRDVVDAHADYYDSAVLSARAALDDAPEVSNVDAYAAATRIMGDSPQREPDASARLATWAKGAAVRAFEPGRSFGFNTQALASYLLAARNAGASEAEVLPAWQAFLAGFPNKLAAGTLDWPDLVAVATFLRADIGGGELGAIGAWLRDQVADRANTERGPNGPSLKIIESEAGGQTGQAGFARLVVEFRNSAHVGLSVACRLDSIPRHLREATYRGMRSAAAASTETFGGVRAIILGALVHPVDATPSAFERAGASAVVQYLDDPLP
jgi:hypothetical protein